MSRTNASLVIAAVIGTAVAFSGCGVRNGQFGNQYGGFGRSHINLDDLRGAGDDYAARQLGNRGFAQVNPADQGKARTWYNPGTDQCVEVYYNRGTVSMILPKGGHDCHKGNNSANANVISPQAQSACLARFAEHNAAVTNISPLKPGHFEVMMANKNNTRRVACTVNQNGKISDWVNLQ